MGPPDPNLALAAANVTQRYSITSSATSNTRSGTVRPSTTSLGNAVRRLREGLARYEREAADEQIRDGLIQRFEFTYELAHKMLGRYLKQTAASPDHIERLPFADLIRTGNAQGLLRGDWPTWRRFRKMRARTSHTYDAKVASQVVSAIPGFWKKPSTSTPNCNGGLHEPT